MKKGRSTVRSPVLQESVQHIETSFERRPIKFIRSDSRELLTPKYTVQSFDSKKAAGLRFLSVIGPTQYSNLINTSRTVTGFCTNHNIRYEN